MYVSLSLFSAQAKPIKLHLKCLVALVFVIIVRFTFTSSSQLKPSPPQSALLQLMNIFVD